MGRPLAALALACTAAARGAAAQEAAPCNGTDLGAAALLLELCIDDEIAGDAVPHVHGGGIFGGADIAGTTTYDAAALAACVGHAHGTMATHNLEGVRESALELQPACLSCLTAGTATQVPELVRPSATPLLSHSLSHSLSLCLSLPRLIGFAS